MFIFPSGIPSATGYTIENAVWFDGAADYLELTIPSGGNTKTWTISCWFKLAKLGSDQLLFGSETGNADHFSLYVNSSNQIQLNVNNRSDSAKIAWTSTQLLRDVSAWYNIVWSWNTDVSTPICKIWLNGSEVTAWTKSTNSLAQNDETSWNYNATNSVINVGARSRQGTGPTNYAGVYVAELIHQDGTVVTDASNYGEFDDNGIWIAKNPSALTFGNNGFWLDFSVAPGTGNGAGTDASGEGNHFSETSMTTSQKVTDTPGADSADDDIGNYCTWNPLQTTTGMTFSNGNLQLDSTSNWYGALGTIGVSSGKWYWEVNVGTATPGFAIGVADADTMGNATDAVRLNGWTYGYDAEKKFDHSGTGSSYAAPSTPSSGQVFQVALDMDEGEIFIGQNNTWLQSSNPSTGSSPMFANLSGTVVPGYDMNLTSDAVVANFGQTAFAYTPPTGFKALNTANLPAPTISDPSQHHHIESKYIIPHTTTFDGTNDYMTRGAQLTGAADGKQMFTSFWAKPASLSAEIRPWACQAAYIVVKQLATSGYYVVECYASDNTEGVICSTTVGTTAGEWHHFACSVDLANSVVQMYLNGVDVTGTPSYMADVNMDWTRSDFAIGATEVGNQKYNGQMAEMIIDDVFIDLDDPVNLAKFIDSDGNPVYAGADASIACAAQPLVYLKNPYGSFQTNLGTGGNFSVTGALAAGTADTKFTNFTLPWNAGTYDTLFIIKSLGTEKWYWIDSINGVNKYTSSDTVSGHTTDSNVLSVSGTTCTLGSTLSNHAYVVECHKAGLSASRDTSNSGSISDTGFQRSTNSTSGFSILLYTGNASDGATVEHGFSSAPDFGVIIRTDTSRGGQVKHSGLTNGMGGTYSLYWDAQDAQSSSAGYGWWEGDATTISLETGGTNALNVNGSSATYTGYIWKAVEGYSAFGTYEGNNADDGPYIFGNMRPSHVFVKNIDAGSTDWQNFYEVLDDNVHSSRLSWIGDYAEATSDSNQIDILSTGFKQRCNHANNNASNTYIYGMWAQSPFGGSGVAQARAR